MWLAITTIVLFLIIIIMMPKRISGLETYSTSCFALAYGLITDIIFDLTYELYGYFDHGADLKSLVILLSYYPLYNAIFLNYFPQTNRVKQALYIMVHTLFLTCYEYMLLQTEAFYYNGWKLWFSFLLYPFILMILYWNFLLVGKLYNTKAKRWEKE